MARTFANSAVYAGLLSFAVVGNPTNAYALSLPVPGVTADTALPFSAGVVCGAALCAGIMLGADALHTHMKNKERQELENGATSAQPQIAAQASHEFSDGRSYTPSHAARGWEHAQDPSTTQIARASHATNDYVEIAQNKARVADAKRRRELKTRGVGNVLLERLGAGLGLNMMEGLPVIPRADGTIADVGTSWWRASVDASTMREGFSGFEMPSVLETTEMEEAELAAETRLWDMPAAAKAASVTQAPAAVAQTSVVEPAAPMVEAAGEQELQEDELWLSAMRAMEGLSREDAPFEFEDNVGAGDSLDDPDDLESPTTFIPFKTPAGHPEVVDTESYISYILDDEFSKLQSNSVKATAKSYLKVIEGGTTKTLTVRKTTHSANYVPRHMKPSAEQAL